MPRGISLLVPFREGGESAVVAHSEKIALHYEMPQSDSEEGQGLETKPIGALAPDGIGRVGELRFNLCARRSQPLCQTGVVFLLFLPLHSC